MNQSVPVYTGSCWNPSIDEFRGYSVDWIVTLLGVDVVISNRQCCETCEVHQCSCYYMCELEEGKTCCNGTD